MGLVLSAGASRVLRAYLYGTQPWDPTTLVIVSLVLLAAGATACLAPAWRATAVDPLTVLKTE